MDTSVEDYHKHGIVNVDENAGTPPYSPTVTNSDSKDGGNEPKWGSNCTIAATLFALLLVLVATGLGLGLALGDNDSDYLSSRDAEFSLGLEDEIGKSPGGAPLSATPTMTPFPSDMPSSVPSVVPSDVPSETPSDAPSNSPSFSPTSTPTTAPTVSPTAAPTGPTFQVNPEPRDPPRGYFNYDPNSRFGPSNWNRVDTSSHWLREFTRDGFGIWRGYSNDDLTRNQCDGPTQRQSPKDLVGTVDCDAGHEIRTECAQHPLSDDEHFEKLILPHKLSIQFRRRTCTEWNKETCLVERPPMADYPRYSSGPLNVEQYSDMHHFDIKVPSEHTMEGERYDAEIQMFHTSLASVRFSSIGVLVKADGVSYNAEYQVILNEFQRVFDLHAMQCARRRLQVREDGHMDNSTLLSIDDAIHNLTTTRQWQRLPNFDPYSDAIMTTMFFYRYDGSITEPPCKDITWWVMEQPMIISTRQLEQTRRLLFAHVDENCQPTSVHNADQRVVRPIFVLGTNRDIQHCQPGDFRSDVSKGRPPGKRCRGFE